MVFCIGLLQTAVLAPGADRGLRVAIRHEMQPTIPPIDSPAVRLVTAQQALLIELRIGTGSIKLMAAMNHRAEKVSAFFTKPAHQLLARGDNVHIFGN